MATSITNTSVTTDNLTVDTNTIHVDSTNNNVGIGTSSPSSTHKLTLDHTSNYGGIQLRQSGTQIGQIIQEGGTGNVYVDADSAGTGGGLLLRTNGGTTRMTIDTSGRVTTPNQPSFMVYGGWSYASSTYIWKGFATVDHNIGSHWNNSIGRFTAPVAGRYMIYATAHHSTANTYHLWAFLKNGSLAGGNWVQSKDVNGGDHTTSKTQVWNLAAGDYLEVASNATYPNAYTGGYVTVGGHLVG